MILYRMNRMYPVMVLLFAACFSLSAQTVSLSGFTTGSATASNVSVLVGQPFDAIAAQNGYEVAEGLAQAQLVTEEYTATVNEGEAYTEHGFDYPANTSAGTYNDSRYDLGGAVYGYDLLTKLTLNVVKAVTCGGIVYDGDHNPYPMVEVAGYCWTQKNLRAKHYADGITPIATAMVYASAAHPDATANEETYGRLYSWFSAVNVLEGSTSPPTHSASAA